MSGESRGPVGQAVIQETPGEEVAWDQPPSYQALPLPGQTLEACVQRRRQGSAIFPIVSGGRLHSAGGGAAAGDRAACLPALAAKPHTVKQHNDPGRCGTHHTPPRTALSWPRIYAPRARWAGGLGKPDHREHPVRGFPPGAVTSFPSPAPPELLTGAESQKQPHLSPDGALRREMVTDVPRLREQGPRTSPSFPSSQKTCRPSRLPLGGER